MELYCVDVNDASLSRTDTPRQPPSQVGEKTHINSSFLKRLQCGEIKGAAEADADQGGRQPSPQRPATLSRVICTELQY